MFAVVGTIEDRRTRAVMIARLKTHDCGFRTSYHGRTGASIFNRFNNGEHDDLMLRSYISFPKGTIDKPRRRTTKHKSKIGESRASDSYGHNTDVDEPVLGALVTQYMVSEITLRKSS